MNLPLRPEVEAAFSAALELPVSEQNSFLTREYAHDPDLRRDVEALLRAFYDAGSFLDPIGKPPSLSASAPPLPAAIGPYRIQRLLGEGAMGAVYEAAQEHPRRAVALKVIKPGLAGPELLRRFQLESLVLGRLQHPGIAQVYEAGAADSGFGLQPYFAMELIRGESLLVYAAARQSTARQRLEILAKVCDAVHHAHQRGIIHRDLKPGNILVDESGQPKILDFGVARLTDADAYATRQTDLGHLVGTLAYMSPEQVLADPLELDTRTDVYSLGVILFELLSGSLPYQIARQLPLAVQTIREQEPVLLGSLDRACRGDIETIAAKALEKDKSRRYASAADLAADIRRCLADEPILARSPSAAYHLSKFARRHKALAAGAAAVFAVLVAGIGVSTWEAARARRAEQIALRERDQAATARLAATRDRDRALTAEQAATTERNRAVAEQQRANAESAAAKAINDFLQNDLLAQASAGVQSRPDTKPDPDLKVRTALDRAAAAISGKFDKQPLVEASIRGTIGNTYNDLGLYPEAQAQIERALDLRRRLLGEQHPDTLSIMNDLADLYQKQGKYAKAEPLFAQVLQARHRLLGDEHPDTLRSMSNLAYVYMDQGKYGLAEPLYAKALQFQRRVLGNDDPSTLITMSSLAVLYRSEGKRALAEPLFFQVMQFNQRVRGGEHPETLTSMNNLAVLYWDQGKYPQAESLYTRVLEARKRVLGDEHPNTLNSRNNLAALYRTEGRFAEAEALLTQVLEVRRRVLGEDHRETLITRSNLARLYQDQGFFARAEPLFASILEIRRRALGPEHPDTLNSMNSLARVYLDQKQYVQAEPMFTKVLEARRRVLGAGHLDTLDTITRLATLYLNVHNFARAEPLLREALQGQQKANPDGWQQYETLVFLAASLAGQARFAEAEPLLLDGYQGLVRQKDALPWESRSAPRQAEDRILDLYRDWRKPEKLAAWQAKLGRAPAVSVPRP